ncbi:hypothetical protein [Bacillus anthracis]
MKSKNSLTKGKVKLKKENDIESRKDLKREEYRVQDISDIEIGKD